MTEPQVRKLADTLLNKVEEGLIKLEEVDITSPKFGILLNNILNASSMAHKLTLELPDEDTNSTQDWKGEA